MAKIRGNTQIIDGTIGNLQIAAAAAIATSKLAEGAELLKRDGSVALTGDLNAGNHKLTGLAAGTSNTDAATWGQVQAVAQSLQLKDAVRVATTVASGNIDLATGGLLIIDTVQLVAGDRVLVKNQTDAKQNGIYVAAAGAWARSADADGLPSPNAEVKPGMFTFVTEGSVNADTGWVLATNGTIDVGTTELTFVQFSAAGVIVPGVALTKNGQQLDVVFKEGIEVDGNALRIKLDALSGLEQSATGIKIAVAGVTNSMLAGGITTDKLEDGAEFVQRDGSVAFTGDVDAGTHKVVNVVAGTATTDAVNKGQMDAAIAAIDVSSQIAPIQDEIDAIELGAGLGTDGTYTANASADYIATATSLKDADDKLDAALAIVAADVATKASQAEVDAIEAGAGLGTNGAYVAPTGSNYLDATTSLANADLALDTKLKEVADAVDALETGGVAGLQDEVDAVEAGAGLETDGTYAADATTNYLQTATSLKDADKKLDTQVKANADAVATKAAQTEVDAIETAAGLNADGTLPAYTGTNYLNAETSLRAATIALDTQVKANADAAAGKASQTEVDAVEAAVGLNADGTLAAYTGTNYLNAASTIKAATIALDTQVKANTDAVALKASQTEVDAIETAVGLNADGTLAAYTGTNYLNAATSIKNATVLLDTQAKALADGKFDKSSVSIDGTFATPSDTEVPSTQAVKTYLEGQVADNAVGFVDDEVPAGTIDGTNATFTLAGVANPPAGVHLYVNGLRTAISSVTPGASNTTIVLAAAPQVGDVITADYRI